MPHFKIKALISNEIKMLSKGRGGGLHGGIVGGTVALQQEGPWFKLRLTFFMHGVCILSFASVNILASSYTSKNMTVWSS